MNVFGESDSDSDSQFTGGPSHLAVRKQRKIKEVSQGEAIYQYDEVYDDIKESQKKAKSLKLKDASEVLNTLQEAKRKRDLDKILLKQQRIDKERELESDELKSKDIFITDSYREYKQEIKLQVDQLEEKKDLHSAVNKLHTISTEVDSSKVNNPKIDVQAVYETDEKEDLKSKIQRLIQTKISEKDLEGYKRRYSERQKS